MPLIKDKVKYINAAHAAEIKHGLPRNILVGLIGAESNFNPNAVSPVGARGLAQFMPSTAKEYGIDPLDPYQSIDAAGKYLASSYKKFNNWEDSLRSYNMGVGGLQKVKAGKRTLPKETQDYVGRVYAKAGINYSEPTYANSVEPYINQPLNITVNTPQISNLENPLENINLAEESPKQDNSVEIARIELQQKQNEENLFNDLLKASQIQYVDQNQVYDYTQNQEQVYQNGGIIKDNNGYWNPANWGKVVEINSPKITMVGVSQPLLGVSNQTGEQKLMLPNQNYNFASTQQVTEYPIRTKNKRFR